MRRLTARTRSRRGAFTLAEAAFTFVILGILATITVPVFNAVRTNTERQQAGLRLRAAVVQARDIAGRDGYYTYPVDVAATLGALDGAYGTGPVTGLDISVRRVSDDVLHLATARDSGGCIVVVDTISTDTQRFAYDADAAACDANLVGNVTVTGSFENPNSVTLSAG